MTPSYSFHTKIVGVTFKNDDGTDRQRIIRDLIRSGSLETGTELFLVPQPTNPYDRNCISVQTQNGQTIGNLSREVAATVAPKIQQGFKFRAFVASCTGGDIGFAYGINIRIDQSSGASMSSTSQSTGVVKSRSTLFDEFDDYEDINSIARSEGYIIDDDGHWVPLD